MQHFRRSALRTLVPVCINPASALSSQSIRQKASQFASPAPQLATWRQMLPQIRSNSLVNVVENVSNDASNRTPMVPASLVSRAPVLGATTANMTARGRNFSTSALCLAQTNSSITAADALETVATTYVDPVPAGWSPAAFAELGIVAVHDAFGCPWYIAISGITFGLRTVLLPLVIFQMKNVARLAWVQPEMEIITKQWKAAGGYSAPPKITDGYQKQMKELFTKHNCSPTRSLVGVFIQAPMFISFFVALRHMAGTYPSFQSGGILWFQDLSIPDPTYTLPVIAACTMIATIELGGDTGKAMSEQQESMKYVFRGLAVVMIPAVILSGIPNAVFMYWLTANTFSLFQVLLFKIPGLKAALGIPNPPPKPAAAGAAKDPAVPVIPQAVFDSRPPPKQAPSPAASAKASKGKKRRFHSHSVLQR